MTGFFVICGLIILYYLYKALSRPKSHTNPDQQLQKDHKQNYSPQALALSNILHFPSNKAKITISIENVLLNGMKKANSESYQQTELDFLHLLLEFSQLYLLVEAFTDEEQLYFTNEILSQLSRLAPSVSFPPHRILFHSTEIGKKAIIRQIQPHVHIDGPPSSSPPSSSSHRFPSDDSRICESLSQFVPFMIQIDPLGCDNNQPVLGYPVSLTSGRVYSWYKIPSLSRLSEIQPLVCDQMRKK